MASTTCIEGLAAPPDHIEVPVVPIAPYPRAVFKTGDVARYVSDNYWKLRVPKHLAELPRTKGVIQDIMAEPALKLDLLPSQTLASKILERAHEGPENSNEKAPEKQSDEKAPKKQSNEKAPKKQSHEKAPNKQSDEKAPNKQSDEKAPNKQSDEKAPKKQSDEKAPEPRAEIIQH
eukprot:s11247_g1.t1